MFNISIVLVGQIRSQK